MNPVARNRVIHTVSDEPLKWAVQPRVLFIFDPTQKSLEHVKEFLGNQNCIRIAENTDEALGLIRRSPFDFNLIVLNIQPVSEHGAPHHGEDNHDHYYSNEYFLKEISRLGHLNGVPVIAVSNDPTLAPARPLTAICPANVTVSDLYKTASDLLEGRQGVKQRVM